MPRVHDDEPAAPVALNGHADGVRLAVNLIDLERVTPFIRTALFGPKLARLDASKVLKMDPARFDEMGVAFACPLLDAACILDTMRAHDRKVGDSPTRCYVFRTAWTKVPGAQQLSVMSNGRPILNPSLFRAAELAAGEWLPPEQQEVELGPPAAVSGEAEEGDVEPQEQGW